MTAETDTPRGAPGRPEGSTLQPPRPLLIQVRVTPGEKARILDLARAQGAENMSAYMRRAALRQPAEGPRSAA